MNFFSGVSDSTFAKCLKRFSNMFDIYHLLKKIIHWNLFLQSVRHREKHMREKKRHCFLKKKKVSLSVLPFFFNFSFFHFPYFHVTTFVRRRV